MATLIIFFGAYALYQDAQGWARETILNVVGSAKFSGDRTIAGYATEIWNVKPCAVEWGESY